MDLDRIIRVLTVDDHPIMMSGLAAEINFQTDMKVIAQATDGAEAVEAFRQHRPDITLMDIRMQGMGGIDAIAAIRSDFPKAKIIVLTTAAGDVQISRAFRAGAAAYLLKSLLRTDLVNTIRQVHRGIHKIPSEITQQLGAYSADDDLTARELDVLRGVAAGRANRVIAEHLQISEYTVKQHLKSVMAKLEASDRTDAVVIGIRRGYLEM
jgi:DNA-binding NarL/FixJ family response regulator